MTDTNNAARNEQNSLTAIRKMIGKVAHSATKLNEDIHEAALACMEHARDYGDCQNTAASLVNALPKSHRRNLIMTWFSKYSPIAVTTQGKGKPMKAHLSGKVEDRKWFIEQAKATPFYAMPEAEREPEVISLGSIMGGFATYIKSMETKAGKIKDDTERAKALADIEAIKAVVTPIVRKDGPMVQPETDEDTAQDEAKTGTDG